MGERFDIDSLGDHPTLFTAQQGGIAFQAGELGPRLPFREPQDATSGKGTGGFWFPLGPRPVRASWGKPIS